MARQEQNTEWTQKISFFIFILHIICVSVKRLHILVTSQNGELSTKSGNEPERRVTNMQSKNQPCILERRINEEENKPENPR